MTRTDDPDPVMPLPTGARSCPVCGKRSIARHQPFCSGRCADVDLGRWLNGTYRVETAEPAEDSDESGKS